MTTTAHRRSLTGRELLLILETILFSILVPGAVAYWVPRYAFGLWGRLPPPRWTVWHLLAVLPLAVGLVVYLRCLWEFAARGRGIPAPIDHPKQLVVTGLYRYVRNPMYVGVLLFLLGESLLFQSTRFLLYTAAWFLVVNVVILVYEEPNLRAKFGDSYVRYAAAVRRWVPGLRYQPDDRSPLGKVP